jgi:hypothetical protein
MTPPLATQPTDQTATATLRHVIRDVIDDKTLMSYLDFMEIHSVEDLMAASLRDLQDAACNAPQNIAPFQLEYLVGFKALVVWMNSSDLESERIGTDYGRITADDFIDAMYGMAVMSEILVKTNTSPTNMTVQDVAEDHVCPDDVWRRSTSPKECEEEDADEDDDSMSHELENLACYEAIMLQELNSLEQMWGAQDVIRVCHRSVPASVKVLKWGEACYDSTFIGAGTEREYNPGGTVKTIPRYAHARVDDHGHVGTSSNAIGIDDGIDGNAHDTRVWGVIPLRERRQATTIISGE